MAKNAVFAYDPKKVEIWTLAATTASGAPVINGTKAGVTLTATGDSTKSATVGPYIISGIPGGGVGLTGKQATVATDGTWEFAVTGATGSTAQETAIYITSGGTLTTTSTSNTLFGYVNLPLGYTPSATAVPVKIGA